MGLFSFLFGKKKEKKEEVELKKITTFEIVESTPTQKKDSEEAKHPTVIKTVEAIEEEKCGEATQKNIVNNVEESKESAESQVVEEGKSTAAPAPIEIVEESMITEEKPKQKSVSRASKPSKNSTQKQNPSKEIAEVVPPEADTASEASTNHRVGKFEIKKSKDGRFVFNLFASNHVIVATSQIYSSAQSALIGIKSIIANAEKSPIEDTTLKNYTALPYPKWEIYLDKSQHYRFRLYASNGSCVVHSQGYTSKANCKKGIESIMKCAPTAEIDKTYLKKPE